MTASLACLLCTTQIKVRDLSSISVNLAPAEFSNWQEARTSLIAEKKSGMKAQLEAELSCLADDSGLENIRSKYTEKERSLEHSVDHDVHTFSAILDLEYKYAFILFSV